MNLTRFCFATRAALRTGRRSFSYRGARKDDGDDSDSATTSVDRGARVRALEKAWHCATGWHRANCTVPNMLTMLRLSAAPPVAVLFATGHHQAAFWAFGCAGALDFWDGYLARRWDQCSVLGTMLDPLADKVLVASLALPMALTGVIPAWVATIIVGRDVGLIGSAFWYRHRTRPLGAPFFDSTGGTAFSVQPSLLGKINMAAQLGCITVALTHAAWDAPSHDVVTCLAYGVAASTVASGFDYLRNPRVTNLLNSIGPDGRKSREEKGDGS